MPELSTDQIEAKGNLIKQEKIKFAQKQREIANQLRALMPVIEQQLYQWNRQNYAATIEPSDLAEISITPEELTGLITTYQSIVDAATENNWKYNVYPVSTSI